MISVVNVEKHHSSTKKGARNAIAVGIVRAEDQHKCGSGRRSATTTNSLYVILSLSKDAFVTCLHILVCHPDENRDLVRKLWITSSSLTTF